VPPLNLETALAGMLPPADLAVVKAMVGGDPVDEAVTRLTRASEGDTLDPKEVSDVLRGLRAKADGEVRQEAKAETETLKAANVPAEQVLSALELIQQKRHRRSATGPSATSMRPSLGSTSWPTQRGPATRISTRLSMLWSISGTRL